MSRDNLDKNYKRKIVHDTGNQITTYDKEPTTWIEISENELPESIGNQDIVKVFQYHQISNQGCSNDVLVIEESFIQDIDTTTTATQTDYVIDVAKYSKEAIKPYFLNYLDIEDKHSKEPALNFSERSLNSSKKLEVSFDGSAETSRVDAETDVTPKSSTNIFLQIRKSLESTIETSFSKIVVGPTFTDSILQKDNSRRLFPLVHDIIKLPQSLDAPESQITTFNNQNSSSICDNLIQNIVLNEVNNKEELFLINMAGPCDEDPLEGDPETCPTPLNCCGERRKQCDDGKDEVNIICRKGDVKFKLRCKKIDGNTAQCDKIGNEVRYECEILPNQCVDRSILESCDLKCSLVNSSNPNIIIPHNIKNDKGYPNADKTPHSPPDSPPPSSPRNFSPQSSPPRQSSSPSLSSIQPCPPCPICPDYPVNSNDLENSNSKVKLLVGADQPPCNSQHSIYSDSQSNVEVTILEECSSEKQDFACRSKNEINDCRKKKEQEVHVNCFIDNVGNSNKPPPCVKEPGILDEITTAMGAAHCKTMATLRLAAEDILTNVNKAVSQSAGCTEDSSSTLNKIKHSATNIVCELQKKVQEADIKETVNTVIKTGGETIKNVSKSTREALEEAAKQTKIALGYNKSDDDSDKDSKCKSPCRSRCKKTACSKDNSESEKEFAESVRESVEKFYDNVCKTTQDITDVVTDYTGRNIDALRPTDGEDTSLCDKTEHSDFPKGSVKQLVFEALTKIKDVENVSDNDNLQGLKKSAENMMQTFSKATEKIAAATEKIAECTQEACSGIAEQSKKLFKSSEQGNEVQRKKENIKTMLSGLRFFQQEESKPERKEKEKSGSSFHSLKSSLSSLGSLGRIEIKERSSPYDTPTPPKEVALVDSGTNTRVSGLFTNIKDKIFAMFYDSEKQDLDSDSMDSGSDVSIAEAAVIINDKKTDDNGETSDQKHKD